MVKSPPAKAGDMGLIPGLGRSPGEKKMGICSSILAWKIPWTEDSGGLLDHEVIESDMTEHTC